MDKPKPTVKPTKGFPGAVERLESSGGDPIMDFKDIFMNHNQDQIDMEKNNTLQTHWKVTAKKEIGVDVQKFERYEKNGTGLGMTEEIVNGKFFSILTFAELERKYGKPKGGGVYSIGETNFWFKLTKENKELRKLGIEVLTKTRESDYWYHVIYDPYNETEIKEGNYYTKQEVIDDLKLPVVNEIGECGTYTKCYISTEGLQSSWYTDVVDTLNLYFSGALKSYWDATVERDTSSLLMKPQVTPLIGVHISSEANGGHGESFQKTTVDYFGKSYELQHCVRISTDDMTDKKLRVFENQMRINGTKRAFQSTHTYEKSVKLRKETRGIGDNLIIIIQDEKRKWAYEICALNSKTQKRRVVFKWNVRKRDVVVNNTKDMAALKDGAGKKREESVDTRKMREIIGSLYPQDKTWTENEQRDQVINILYGKKWPIGYRQRDYEELADVHRVPEEYYNNWEWARNNLTAEMIIEGHAKRADIWNEHAKAYIEYKPKEPDPDLDGNQIIATAVMAMAKVVVTVGVSKTKKNVVNHQYNEFKDVTYNRFVKDLRNAKNPYLKEIEWELWDLRYLALDKRLETMELIEEAA